MQALLTTGIRIVVLNRTREHTQRLAADQPTLVTGPLERLSFVLSRASVLVCATAARQPIVDCRTIHEAVANRPRLPLVILDLAMPRAVEPAARAVPGVRLIDLDDLEQSGTLAGQTRAATVERAEALAVEERIAVEVMTTAIINQLLHGPTLALRQAAARSLNGGRRSHAAICQMLQLDRFPRGVGS